MSNFVVSARKYRPIRFDDVVGQQHISQTLKNAIQSNHLAQAFLFCGPRGVGKTTCARILAKVLNCHTPTKDLEPCDTCESCKSFNKNASLNISELDAASNNSVEHIRALIEQVRFAPQNGKYKIYIIDEVHMLSQQAFNAFLKTLEEPPSYAIFILATTEKHKIIPTILSRCQIFDFNRILVSDMTAHLQKICKEENIVAEQEALDIISQKADGALRDALSIFDRIVSFAGNKITYKDVIENLNILDYDYYFKIVDSLLAEDSSQLLLLFDQISRKGFDGDIFVNGLAEHLRNLLVCKDPQTIELLEVSGNIRERYQQQAALTPMSLILSALSLSNDCDINYKMAHNKRLHVEMMLIKMAFAQRAIQASKISIDNASLEKKNLVSSNPITTVKEEQPPVYKTLTPPLKNEKSETNADIDIEAEAELKSDNQPIMMADTIEDTTSFADKFNKKSTGGFLSKMVNEVKEEYQKSEKEGLPLNMEHLQKLWEDFYKAIESPSTQVFFRTAVLSIEDAETGRIKVITSGNLAKDAILRERKLRELLVNTFQKKTLTLEVEIEESKIEAVQVQKKLPISDRDKYVYFLEMNPHLKDFQKRFGLLPPKGN